MVSRKAQPQEMKKRESKSHLRGNKALLHLLHYGVGLGRVGSQHICQFEEYVEMMREKTKKIELEN